VVLASEAVCCLLSGPALSPVLQSAIEHGPVRPCTEPTFGAGRPDSVVFYGWEPSFSTIVRLASPEHARLASLCKDKAAFRRLTRDLVPDFQFSELRRDELLSFRPPYDSKALVLKPSIGTNSIGVRVVASASAWEAAARQSLAEIARSSARVSLSVVSDRLFLVEDYVDGAEFACDGFWNRDGQAVIAGLYEHPFGAAADVGDVVYFTSRPIMRALLPTATDLLNRIGARLKARRFAFHLEFRQRRDGVLVPIELNPLRFGQIGFSDLAFHAFGHTPYLCFFTDRAPDWTTLCEGDDGICALIVALAAPETDRATQHATFLASVGPDCVEYLAADREDSPFLGIAFTRVASRDDIARLLVRHSQARVATTHEVVG
jgi:hypothetical protein